MLEKLKKRWDIESNFQVIVLLFVFAIAGSSTLYARKGIFFLLGVTADTSLWMKIPLYVLVIFPTYQVIFLVVGALFGQFKFVWKFEKKVLARLGLLRKEIK